MKRNRNRLFPGRKRRLVLYYISFDFLSQNYVFSGDFPLRELSSYVALFRKREPLVHSSLVFK